MVGDGVYLRLGVAAEAGYDTNVFYNDEQRVDSATLHVIPSLEINNTAREGGAKPPLTFSLGANLLYREYLNDDTEVRAQRAFNPSFFGNIGYARGGAGITLSDTFTRTEDPPYQKGAPPITRDLNLAVLGGGVTPGGGRLALSARYSNTLDLFETEDLDYANRMMHDLMLDTSWRWLPKTALFFAVGAGYSQYLDEDAAAAGKSNSIPYRVVVGLRGLITPKLVLTANAGYADAIYDNKAIDPTGTSNVVGGLGLAFSATEWTSLAATYIHELRDSPVLGSYYDLDAVDLGVAQRIGPFTLGLTGRYEFRRFKGFQGTDPIERNDHVYQVRLQGDYMTQQWFYIGFSYLTLISRTSSVNTTALNMGNLDYGKHVILGRLGITY